MIFFETDNIVVARTLFLSAEKVDANQTIKNVKMINVINSIFGRLEDQIQNCLQLSFVMYREKTSQ